MTRVSNLCLQQTLVWPQYCHVSLVIKSVIGLETVESFRNPTVTLFKNHQGPWPCWSEAITVTTVLIGKIYLCLGQCCVAVWQRVQDFVCAIREQMGRDGQDKLLGPRPAEERLLTPGTVQHANMSSPTLTHPTPNLLLPRPHSFSAGSDTQGHPVLQGPHRHGPLRGAGRHRRARRWLQREREERLQTVQQRQRGDPHLPGQEARGEDPLAAGLPRGEEDGAGGWENRSVAQLLVSLPFYPLSAAFLKLVLDASEKKITFESFACTSSQSVGLNVHPAEVCRGPSLICGDSLVYVVFQTSFIT